MLVLSRARNESVVLGENIVVTVIEIKGSKVRLGIQAPPEVDVDRAEVRERTEAAFDDTTEHEPLGR